MTQNISGTQADELGLVLGALHRQVADGPRHRRQHLWHLCQVQSRSSLYEYKYIYIYIYIYTCVYPYAHRHRHRHRHRHTHHTHKCTCMTPARSRAGARVQAARPPRALVACLLRDWRKRCTARMNCAQINAHGMFRARFYKFTHTHTHTTHTHTDGANPVSVGLARVDVLRRTCLCVDTQLT
jgi:hypothetical protein